MQVYIATFYAHFGAVRFRRELQKKGISGKLMPVPRNLSSSCGTCVRFEAEQWIAENTHGEIEQIVKVEENGYESIYHVDDN